MAYLSPSKVIPDKTTNINGVTLNEYLIINHNINKLSIPAQRKDSIKWIAIHNTEDLVNVEDDGRNYIASSINGNMGGVFANVYVDDLCAWQLLDWNSENWCSSDYSNPLGANRRGISIEIIMNGTAGTANVKARDNGARLAAWLLFKNNLTTDNLVTHTWAINTVKGIKGSKDYLCTYTGNKVKVCPYYIIPTWTAFVSQVQTYLDELIEPTLYYVRRSVANTASQLGCYKILENAKYVADYNRGYKVFDSNGVKVYQPKQYFQVYTTIQDKVPYKAEPLSNAKTLGRADKGQKIIVYLGTDTTAENGTVWVKGKYEDEVVWLPLKYLK